MEFKVEDFSTKELKNGKFVKPYLANFRLNGESRDWEIVKASDSVAILLYNTDSDSFVCVKQFRPPVYFRDSSTNGVTLELCAGILDKDLSLEETASEEILEECGFRIAPQDLEKITSFYTSVGFAGAKQHLYFAKVNEACRVSEGGGVAGEEMIEVVEIPLKEVKSVMYNEEIPKTPGLLFAFNWFISQQKESR
jgi:UDP-sugar diphosphatase